MLGPACPFEVSCLLNIGNLLFSVIDVRAFKALAEKLLIARSQSIGLWLSRDNPSTTSSCFGLGVRVGSIVRPSTRLAPVQPQPDTGSCWGGLSYDLVETDRVRSY